VSADQITSGTLSAARLPAYSGDVSSAGGTAALTVQALQGRAVSAVAPAEGDQLCFHSGTWGPCAKTVVQQHVHYVPVCEGATARLPFSAASTNVQAVCASTGVGGVQFPAQGQTTAAVQGFWATPTGFGGTVDAVLRWNATAVQGNVTWRIMLACATDGTQLTALSWSTPVVITTAAPATTGAIVTSTATGMPVAGCASGSFLAWRLERSTGDTMTDSATVLALSFSAVGQ